MEVSKKKILFTGGAIAVIGIPLWEGFISPLNRAQKNNLFNRLVDIIPQDHRCEGAVSQSSREPIGLTIAVRGRVMKISTNNDIISSTVDLDKGIDSYNLPATAKSDVSKETIEQFSTATKSAITNGFHIYRCVPIAVNNALQKPHKNQHF